MFKSLFSTLLLLTYLSQAHSASIKSHPQAKLGQGLAIGRSINGIDSWRSIPYAQKPVESLRLIPPISPKGFTGKQHFYKDPDACFNVNSTAPVPSSLSDEQEEKLNKLLADALSYPANKAASTNNNNSTAIQSEDCLYLNVYRPSGTKARARLPVLVWIYGGGFTASDITQYRPEALVQRSVDLSQPMIYVQMNYRLGAYGFLNGQEVLDSSKANLGLRDQALAIDWVHENINHFGGDNSKVTLWGESAGALSLGMHLVRDGTTSSKGVYRSMIMESGSPYRIPNSSTFDDAFTQMATSTGCNSSENAFKCLQQLPVDSFNTAMNAVSVKGRLGFSPGVDGDFIPYYPDKMMKEGKYKKDVRILNGQQHDEGTILTLGAIKNVTDEAGFDNYLRSIIPGLKESQYSKLKELYPSDPTQGAAYDTGSLYNITGQNKRVASILGDMTFSYTRRLLLDEIAKTKQYVYSYVHGTFKSTPFLGSYHAIEMVNTFGWMKSSISDEMTARWIGFVNNQVPDSKGYKKFPRYEKKEKNLLYFGEEKSRVEKDDFRKEAIKYLEEVISG